MKKLFHRTHDHLNAAALKIHAPLSRTCPSESRQRAETVEVCIRILTSLGFLVHYPDGSSTIKELCDRQEVDSGRERVIEKPAHSTQEAFNPWNLPALSTSPHARTIKF